MIKQLSLQNIILKAYYVLKVLEIWMNWIQNLERLYYGCCYFLADVKTLLSSISSMFRTEKNTVLKRFVIYEGYTGKGVWWSFILIILCCIFYLFLPRPS